MQSNATRAIVAIVLLICVVCPMVELFDYWDHTIQTGNDTEYTLVALALCIGIVFTLVRFTVTLFSRVTASNASCRLPSLESASFLLIASAIFPAAAASPPLHLRI